MFSAHVLELDVPRTAARIMDCISRQVRQVLRRRGVVVGLSGGVDSSVVAALCSRALGQDHVLGLLMPERDSEGESLVLGERMAEHAGVPYQVEDMAPVLTASGCYTRQIDAIRRVIPEYGEGWRCKLTLPSLTAGARLTIFWLTVQSPEGDLRTARMPADAYRQLVAATNFKQRARKMMEYYHADRLHYAVAGTPNRLEYDQGFFVKHGDGAADFKPIAHLYKTQVYALAEYLDVPKDIRARPPTTDTFSMAQTQEEFYFALPYREMDLCLFGYNHGAPAAEVAAAIGLDAAAVERIYQDIGSKRRATRYLHRAPLLVEPVAEVDTTSELQPRGTKPTRTAQ